MPDNLTPEDELLQLEQRRSQAIRQQDWGTLLAIYAEDFTAVAANGQVVTRDEVMALFQNLNPSVAFETSEMHVHLFGEVGIVTGRLTGRTPTGEALSSARFLHVYVKRSAGWQFVIGQSTPVQ